MSNIKDDIIPVIKWLSIDLDEVVIDIMISDELFFHTIEWRRKDNRVILHRIVNDFDFAYDLEDFDSSTQSEICNYLIRNFLG